MIMGFPHEYTYQNHEYNGRTRNTKHARAVHKWVFLLQPAHRIALSVCKIHVWYVVSTSVIKLLRKLVCDYLCCSLQFTFYLGIHCCECVHILCVLVYCIYCRCGEFISLTVSTK